MSEGAVNRPSAKEQHDSASFRRALDTWRSTGTCPASFLRALSKLASWVCRRYNPQLYSPDRVWNDDAYWTVAVEVSVIIKRGYLKNRQYINRDEREIRSYLASTVRSYIRSIAIRRAPRGRALYLEVKETLNTDSRFMFFTSPRGWGLREGAADRAAEDASAAENATISHSLVAPDTELNLFMRKLIAAAGRPIGIPELMKATRAHFGVCDVIECPWPTFRDPDTGEERLVDFEDTRTNLEMEVQIHEAVQAFLDELVREKTPRPARGISLRKKAGRAGRT